MKNDAGEVSMIYICTGARRQSRMPGLKIREGLLNVEYNVTPV